MVDENLFNFQFDNQTNSCFCISEQLVVCVVLFADDIKQCSYLQRIALNGIQKLAFMLFKCKHQTVLKS